MQTFVARDGQQIGIWAEDELRQLYDEGQLLPTDYYWRDGMTDWGTLDQLLGGLSAGTTVPQGHVEPVGTVYPARTVPAPASARRSSPPRWLVPVFLGLTAIGVIFVIVGAVHIVRQQLAAPHFVEELADYAAQQKETERKQLATQGHVTPETNVINGEVAKLQAISQDEAPQDRSMAEESIAVLQEIKERGETCHAAEKDMLTLGFNPNRLTSQQEIDKRRQVIQSVLPVIATMVDYLKNLDQQIRNDLLSKGVTQANTDNFLEGLRHSGNPHNLLVYWQQEAAICSDLLANLDVLRDSYGQWHVKDDKVLFDDPATLAQYQANVSKLRADIDTQKAAQNAAQQDGTK